MYLSANTQCDNPFQLLSTWPSGGMEVACYIRFSVDGNNSTAVSLSLQANPYFQVAPQDFLQRYRLPHGSPGFGSGAVLPRGETHTDIRAVRGPRSQRTFALEGEQGYGTNLLGNPALEALEGLAPPLPTPEELNWVCSTVDELPKERWAAALEALLRGPLFIRNWEVGKGC